MPDDPSPIPQSALFKQGRPLTAVVPGEPCLALIRNDAVFNLLIATTCYQRDNALVLDQVWWFSARGAQARFETIPMVHLIVHADGVWRALDPARRKIIRQPSRIPYHLIFLDGHGYDRLRQAISARDAAKVFANARDHFGHVPGFDFSDDVLISPPGYATADGIHPNDCLPD